MYSKHYEILTMKQSIFFLVLLCNSILSAVLGIETSGNLVKNGGFEEYDPKSMQPEYWQFQSWRVDASGAVEEKCIRSGDYGLLIHIPAVMDKKTYARYIQKVHVKPDTEYVLYGWMKNFEYVLTNGSEGCFISVCAYAQKEELVRVGQRVAQGSRWKKFTKTFKTGTETIEVVVSCVVSGISGDTFFDDISIIEASKHNN